MNKILPKDITSYDLLKTFAVIIMVIDHVGGYFFPEELWFRAVGRIGFPIWFFLVGYARGRDLPFKLLFGAGILLVGNIIVGMPVFPLNALVTIALIRVLIDPVMTFCMKSKTHLWLLSLVLFLLVLPTCYITEYGTQALILGIYGYYVRHKNAAHDRDTIPHYMIFAFASFVMTQMIVSNFAIEQGLFMGAGTLAICALLSVFSALSGRAYPVFTNKAPRIFVWALQFCGHRTLEIYVVHLLFFKALALYLGMEGTMFLRLLS